MGVRDGACFQVMSVLMLPGKRYLCRCAAHSGGRRGPSSLLGRHNARWCGRVVQVNDVFEEEAPSMSSQSTR